MIAYGIDQMQHNDQITFIWCVSTLFERLKCARMQRVLRFMLIPTRQYVIVSSPFARCIDQIRVCLSLIEIN